MLRTSSCRHALLALLLMPGLAVAAGSELVNVRFEHLGLEQGLSQSFVYAIVQDRVGYLWIGTQDGLNRFDGHRFKVFGHDPDAPGSLHDEAIRTLYEDRAGTLWVGTDGGGLARFDPATETFTVFRHDPDNPESLADDRVRSLHEDAAGNFWVGTDGGGLDRLDRARGVFEHLPGGGPGGLGNLHVWDLVSDAQGTLWIATDGGLHALKPGTRRFERYLHDPEDPASLSSNRTRALAPGADGALWVGTEDAGLNRFDRASGRARRFGGEASAFRDAPKVQDIHIDADGTLWVGTINGLLVRRREDSGFRRYAHDAGNRHSLSDNAVNVITEDRQGLLWLGTHRGLNSWNPLSAAMLHYRQGDRAHGLSHNTVTSFAEERDGTLWVGTYGGGLNRLDPGTGRFSHWRQGAAGGRSVADDHVMALLVDRRGTLWVGTAFGGLDAINAAKGERVTFAHDPEDPGSLSANGVSGLLEDRRGRLWVATFGGGLNRLDPGSSRFRHYRHDPDDGGSLSSDRVVSLLEDSQGQLWFGTYGGGLNRYDAASDRFERIRHVPGAPESLSGDDIFTLLEDNLGNLWIGTQARGLNVWRAEDRSAGNTRFARLSERQGLPHNTIYGAARGPLGNLWFSTGRGLARVTPAGEVRSFGLSAGLQGHEYNLSAALAGRDGTLYFGGVNGFNAFRPEALAVGTQPPPVVISSVSSPTSQLAPAAGFTEEQPLELSHGENQLAFEFAALDYTDTRRNRYAYRLEGFDAAWVEAGTTTRAAYTNLPPGEYVFRVKGANGAGVWNELGASLPLRIAPAPWQSPWALAAYGALALLLLLALLRFQAARAQRAAALRQAAELETINQALRHEIEDRERAERSRAAIESQLAQTQRLTAIGQLTGGIAHDFNNLLTVILGCLELLKFELQAGRTAGRGEHYISEAMDAASTGANLVRQMLSFASRQEAEPEIVELTAHLRHMLPLVRRAAGEQIVLQEDIEAFALRVSVDVGQLTAAILNLVINAREAGSRRIELKLRSVINDQQSELMAPLPTGEYLVIEVVDDGRGMADETLTHAFEPFYSTKTVGSGSGLGLSMVYGFAAQAGGTAAVRRNELGGISARIVLPVCDGELSIDDAPPPAPPRQRLKTGARALVVEDQRSARIVAAAFLDSLGYDVSSAADADEARAAVESGLAPDFCFIDVIMPGTMTGIELSRWIAARLPDTEILLTSGYLGEAPEDLPFPLLRKPYRIEELSLYLDAIAASPPSSLSSQAAKR